VEEGITEVVFLGPESLDWFLKSTYRSIAETLGEDLGRIKDELSSR
jgi:hypothetical protein